MPNGFGASMRPFTLTAIFILSFIASCTRPEHDAGGAAGAGGAGAEGDAPGVPAIVDDTRRIRACTVADVKGKLDRGEQFHLVDVREESEWAAGRLPTAEHLRKGVIERDIGTRIPDTKAPIVLYCASGHRSALAADRLQKMGYENVVSMGGGIRGWQAAGHPIVKD
jgi:rhodanese-related sulfurtransferase